MRLSTRLPLLGVAVLALTIAAIALGTYQLVRVTGREAVDDRLRDELAGVRQALVAALEADAAPDALARAAQQHLATHPGTDRHLTVVHVGADTFTTRSGPEDLLELQEDGRLPTGDAGRLRTVDTPEGPVRVLHAPLRAGDRTVGSVVVLGPLDEVRDDAADSLVRVGAAGAVGLLVGGVVLAVVTRRALRPLATLADAAARTDRATGSTRVPEGTRRDEVGELARELNRMLGRIEADAEDRRRLVSAVSHELRTPLAVATGHLDLHDAEGAAEDPPATRAVLRVVRRELDRLALVASDLDAVVGSRGPGDVEVGAVFAPDVVDELRDRLAGLGMSSVALPDAPPVVLVADQPRLAQALVNLVTNAVEHNPDGTPVRVEVAVRGGEAVLSVVDEGAGLDPSLADRAFEPFVTTRADGSTRGRGLGLAIARSLVEAQGGTLGLDTGPTGTRATITLPVEPGVEG